MRKPDLLVVGPPPQRLEREFTVIGKPVDRRDGLAKVTGKAEYAGDIRLPNMIYAGILRSPHAHAKVVSVDTRRAEELKGVRAILTKDNSTGWNTYWYGHPYPAFPERITCPGQEVAAVAADDIETVHKALDLINVQYEVLPAVFDPEDALSPNAPKVVQGGNLFDGRPFVLSRGDVEKGFKEADLIVEDSYSTSAQYHATLQTRSCVAHWDGQKLTVYDSCQGVWQAAGNLARSLNLTIDKVRVVVAYQGGGFGSKAGAQRFAHYASRLSMATKRPVKIVLGRPEEFNSHPCRPEAKMKIKMGVRSDGTIVSIQGKAVVNAGCPSSDYYVFRNYVIQPASVLWKCPNVHLEQLGAYTNTHFSGPMRGVLILPGCFFIEAHMDRAAYELDMDPLEFRMKNYTLHGDQVNQIPYSSKNLDKCMRLVADAIGWENRRRMSAENSGRVKKRGLGLACGLYHGCGIPPYVSIAEVHIKHDCSILLKAAVNEIGGGELTVHSMIAAEELGVSVEDVEIAYGDTGSAKYSCSSNASRSTAEMGPAVLKAAAEARMRIFQLVAPALDVRVEDLESGNGLIYVRQDSRRAIGFREACKLIPPDTEIVGVGSRAPNPRDHTGRGESDAPYYNVFVAQAAEVEVDVETGEVRVLRVASAADIGRALNPKFCYSQQHGATVMGIGYALHEEPALDGKTGAMLTSDLHQYRLTTSLETPEIIAFNVEADDPYFAYSAKGIGELPMTATAPAIRNAILHATGLCLNHLPLTRDKVIEATDGKQDS